MSKNQKFPIVLVKNLPFDVSASELYGLAGKFGKVLEIRRGTDPHVKGNCFIVYHSLQEAEKATESLNGFNLKGRYIVALSYNIEPHLVEQARKAAGATVQDKQNEELFEELIRGD